MTGFRAPFGLFINLLTPRRSWMKNLHTFRLAAALLMGTALGSALVAHAQTIIADRQDEVRLAKPAAEDEAVLQLRDDGTPQEAQQKVSLEYMAAEAMVVKGKQ